MRKDRQNPANVRSGVFSILWTKNSNSWHKGIWFLRSNIDLDLWRCRQILERGGRKLNIRLWCCADSPVVYCYKTWQSCWEKFSRLFWLLRGVDTDLVKWSRGQGQSVGLVLPKWLNGPRLCRRRSGLLATRRLSWVWDACSATNSRILPCRWGDLLEPSIHYSKQPGIFIGKKMNEKVTPRAWVSSCDIPQPTPYTIPAATSRCKGGEGHLSRPPVHRWPFLSQVPMDDVNISEELHPSSWWDARKQGENKTKCFWTWIVLAGDINLGTDDLSFLQKSIASVSFFFFFFFFGGGGGGNQPRTHIPGQKRVQVSLSRVRFKLCPPVQI